jgi:hypothetical protein
LACRLIKAGWSRRHCPFRGNANPTIEQRWTGCRRLNQIRRQRGRFLRCREFLSLERLSDQCTDLFFVAERRLNLDRRFNAGVESSIGETLSRGATVEECEENVECSDELTTISIVAPRLDNHSPLDRLKRRSKLNRRSATKKRLSGNAKDLDNDEPQSQATATFRTLI